MAGSTDSGPRHYSAFISYTDADRALALRLQARLERYKLPARLARLVGFTRIKPVFVDRAEMRAASDLDDAIRDGINRSAFLIVVCTPRTPASFWVGREIDLFRSLRGEGILVALFEGDKAQSFHPRLLVNLAERKREPLAADFRRQGDGPKLAMLKIVATLADVNLDELVTRDANRHRRHLLWLGGVSAAIALTISALTFWGYRASIAVDDGRIQASQTMERQLNELRKKIKQGGTLDMAAAINHEVELFYDQQAGASRLPQLELGRAQLLHAKAEDNEKRGDLAAAAADARSAWLISSRVLSKKPSDPKAIYVHAQSSFWVGSSAWRRGDAPLAANAFARYADLADRLVQHDPENNDWRREQGYAYSNLGVVALREARDAARAEQYFASSQSAFRSLKQRLPDDPDIIYELADGEAWLGDVEMLRGDYSAARRHRAEQKRLVEDLLQRDPRNQLYRLAQSSNMIGEADLDAAQGLHRSALQILAAAHEDATSLLAADPENVLFKRRKRAIELFQARSELARATADKRALDRAEQLLDECSKDWSTFTDDELPVYCSILVARAALLRKDTARARGVMVDPRLTARLQSPSLSATWQFDFREECRALGDASLCRN